MQKSSRVKIVEFDDTLARSFAELNYEWIEKGYTVEAHDREVLDHPIEHIIEPGGQIFFAVENDVAIGTVALIPFGDDAFELAKMAVAPESRGKGISSLIMTACIDHARIKGKRTIILESNTKQAAAIQLYRKFGFVETPLDPNSQFSRANIRMELAI